MYSSYLQPITGAATGLLENLKKLKFLDLSHYDITDKEMDDIGKLTTLQSLILTGCRRVTSDGIKKLTNLQQLKIFGLSFTQVNETALEAIAHLNRRKG